MLILSFQLRKRGKSNGLFNIEIKGVVIWEYGKESHNWWRYAYGHICTVYVTWVLKSVFIVLNEKLKKGSIIPDKHK